MDNNISTFDMNKMVSRFYISAVVYAFVLFGCQSNHHDYDATGIIEADEIVVSAEVNGKLLEYSIEEGAQISKDSIIGKIDPSQYKLQSEQFVESINAVLSKTASPEPQIKILEAQAEVQRQQLELAKRKWNIALYEQTRVQKLHATNAATSKQLDDVNHEVILSKKQFDIAQSQIALTERQIQSQRELVKNQNRGILSEQEVFKKRKEAADDLLQKANIQNPTTGTVLSNYVHAGEWVNTGKPLYKIADLNTVYLRSYIDGSQLLKVQLRQDVKITVRYGESQREYTGKIIWISDKSEFTPKTIQTADERAHLVYATKIKIENDGYLKLGMYGEVKFN
ncbi:MAG: HlyD family efflux transporter periplasmic adaptor subunit [Saprospiraceae bacterium]|nr:HlyD family efflux transporter periplasmic adaptor subunit [Saprospiraceae bacterium]